MKTLKLAALVAVVLAAMLCSCRGYKQIPEEELAVIFKEMYVVNSYFDRNVMPLDSVDIYAPVLARHGYTEEDFTRTLTDGAKRKSFRLSDIVDRSLELLQAQYDGVELRVSQLEYIDSLAMAEATETLLCDSTLKLRSKADTAIMKLSVPVSDGQGQFKISYRYSLDSLDANKNVEVRHMLRKRDGTLRSNTTLRVRRRGGSHYYETTLTGGSDVGEVLLQVMYPDKPGRIFLTIDSICVLRLPPLSDAYRVLERMYVDPRLMIDSLEYDRFYWRQADSCPVHALPPFIAPQCDSLLVE